MCSVLSFSSVGQEVKLFLDTVNALGSPARRDLNRDGVEDIILSTGIEFRKNEKGLICIDGRNWEILWESSSRDQLFSQAVFFDANGDGFEDVIAGGRKAQLFCVDGQNGEYIWEVVSDTVTDLRAKGWYQFYTPVFVEDLHGNGDSTLMVINGGGPPDSLGRLPGRMMNIDPVDGTVLWSDTTPDGLESYTSLLKWKGPEGEYLIYGTGGERFGGSLWRVPIDSILTGGLRSSEVMLTDTAKGFIAISSMADLNGDGYEEFIVPGLNLGLTAYDAVNDTVLWQQTWPGYECYTSPAVGYLNEDSILDFAGFYQLGVFPFYGEFPLVVVDGAKGDLLHSDSTGFYQFSSPNVFDIDGDGWDEILYIENLDTGFSTVDFINRLKLVDLSDDTTYYLTTPQRGIQAYSTNLVWDLNRDSNLDLVMARGTDRDDWYKPDKLQISKFQLNLYDPCPSWGSYLGNAGDGRFSEDLCPVPSSLIEEREFTHRLYPNPSEGKLRLEGYLGDFSLLDVRGRTVRSGTSADGEFDLEGIQAGFYVLRTDSGLQFKVQLLP